MATFKENRTQFDKIIAEIDLMQKSYVTIGFQEETKTRDETKGTRRKKGGQSMAQIAAMNEFGTSHIPARPFMRTSFDENRQRIANAISNEYDKIVEGTSTVKRSLNLIGLEMTRLIQMKIRAIYYPPNSPATVRAKGSSKPLIDFGQMIQSVRHKVYIR
jgi:HK97 gp10 family phage protein